MASAEISATPNEMVQRIPYAEASGHLKGDGFDRHILSKTPPGRAAVRQVHCRRRAASACAASSWSSVKKSIDWPMNNPSSVSARTAAAAAPRVAQPPGRHKKKKTHVPHKKPPRGRRGPGPPPPPPPASRLGE